MATIIQRNWQKHIWHLKCHYQNKSWTLNPDAGQALYTQGLFRSQLWMLHYITGPFTLSNSVPLWNYSWMWKPFCFTVERTESPFLLPLSLTSAPPRHSGKGGGNDIGELFTGGWPALIWQKNKAPLGITYLLPGAWPSSQPNQTDSQLDIHSPPRQSDWSWWSSECYFVITLSCQRKYRTKAIQINTGMETKQLHAGLVACIIH